MDPNWNFINNKFCSSYGHFFVVGHNKIQSDINKPRITLKLIRDVPQKCMMNRCPFGPEVMENDDLVFMHNMIGKKLISVHKF